MRQSPLPPADRSILERAGTRRAFLRNTAVTALTAGAIAACKRATGFSAAQQAAAQATPAAHPPPSATPAQQAAAAADAMDAMHEHGIKLFPAKTAGKGNQLLVPRLDHGVKVFVDPESLPLINGTTVDFVKQGLNEAFRFHNPNIKGECGCGESFNV